MGTKPNFIFIVTDQERFPPAYENEKVKEFLDSLPGHQLIRENGVEFLSHYTASAACCPSRASLYTGHYPSLHRVTQTYGAAKEADDPRMVWLKPNTIPTMGNYLQAGGYETKYIGKWHLSFEDIIDEDGVIPNSIHSDKSKLEEVHNKYLEQNLLEKFGFSGWVGPDPHGPEIPRSGWFRDPGYLEQFNDFLAQKENSKEDDPFFVALNFVNPHDIVFFPFWLSLGLPTTDGTVPDIPPPPTHLEDLRTKPSPQLSYLKQYQKAFFPNILDEKYRQLYYYLLKVVDAQIHQVLTRIKNSKFFDNTYVIFTSDHGELLGAHGGLRQKWYNAYQESIHIPFMISHPRLKGEKSYDFLTSSVDIIPTILGLADLNPETLYANLEKTHSEVVKLVGTDLSKIVKLNYNQNPTNLALEKQLISDLMGRTIYIQIEDHITEGNDPVLPIAKNRTPLLEIFHFEYDQVQGPICIEAILKYLPLDDGKLHLHKFVRYWDNPSYWSHPGQMNVQIMREGGFRRGKTQTRIKPLPEELELYDLFSDPLETKNLIHDSVRSQLINTNNSWIFSVLSRELAESKQKYAKQPEKITFPKNEVVLSRHQPDFLEGFNLVQILSVLFNFDASLKPESKL